MTDQPEFNIETARVKECPCRVKNREGVRHYGTDVFFSCVWPEGHMLRSHCQLSMTCPHNGNKLLKSCTYYSEWSLKQVRDAFKKLEESEKHLDAVREVLKL